MPISLPAPPRCTTASATTPASVSTRASHTLAEWLRARGYATAAFVSSFVLDRAFGLDQGFDLYHEPLDKDSFLAAESVTAARDWIAARDGKWFCWLHLWDPHFPYAPPAPFAERYRQDPYAGEIAYMDAELGKLFSFLEDSRRLDSTLLVITGDHGESLGGPWGIRARLFRLQLHRPYPPDRLPAGGAARFRAGAGCPMSIFSPRFAKRRAASPRRVWRDGRCWP